MRCPTCGSYVDGCYDEVIGLKKKVSFVAIYECILYADDLLITMLAEELCKLDEERLLEIKSVRWIYNREDVAYE